MYTILYYVYYTATEKEQLAVSFASEYRGLMGKIAYTVYTHYISTYIFIYLHACVYTHYNV